MRKSRTAVTWCLTCVALVTALSAADLAAAKRPNVLFILTDDQAPWAVGLSEHPHAKTPHLDRLFREGAYLTHCMTVTPVCSPARASLMTSRYGTELGITDWINPRREPSHGLDPAIVTFPRLFADAGYATGLIGKWHLGTEDRYHPTAFGYQYFMGFRSGGNRPKDPTLEVDGEERKLTGLLPDILTDDAIAFLRRVEDQPFLLSLHFRAPHAPWLPVAETDWEPFKNLDPEIPNPDYPKLDAARVKKMTREYLASVASVDRNVGRLLEMLDELGLEKDTVVIFSSDHGYNMGHNGIWHKGNGHWVLTEPPPATDNIPKNQRPNLYDHSLRVPTAVRWPGVVEAGRQIDETVSVLDWFPTLLEMAGIKTPDDLLLRGRSIVPLLKGQHVHWDNDFYAEYSTHHQSRTHMRMYRTPEWKLIRDFLNPGRDELYHLSEDPEERRNLIEASSAGVQQVIQRLDGKIRERMKQVQDPVLERIAE